MVSEGLRLPFRICDRRPLGEICFKIEAVERAVLLDDDLAQPSAERVSSFATSPVYQKAAGAAFAIANA